MVRPEIKMKNPIFRSCTGLTLIELIFSLALISFCVAPIFFLFSPSHKMNISARERLEAMAYANTYLSAIQSLDVERLVSVSKLRDEELYSPYSLQDLQVKPIPEKMHRNLEINTWDPGISQVFFKVIVEIQWKAGATGSDHKYQLNALIPKH
mgnify:CR=1 FL=1